jgi:hypothetical protein
MGSTSKVKSQIRSRLLRIVSFYDKARLIAEAEAIERSEAVLVKPTKVQETKAKKSSKSRAQKKVQTKNNKKVSTDYFCTKIWSQQDSCSG